MNSTNPSRLYLLAGLTALVLAAGACGDGAKIETSKAPLFTGGAAKAGPDEAMMAAVFASALANENMTKNVSSIEAGQTVAGLLSSGDNQLGDGQQGRVRVRVDVLQAHPLFSPSAVVVVQSSHSHSEPSTAWV